MIPFDERERFAVCVRDAWDLAAQGCVLEGYAVLELGLTWAEMPALNPVNGERDAPEPWAAELIALYRDELKRYMTANQPTLGSASLTRRVQLTRATASELRTTARLLCDRAEQLRQQTTKLAQRLDEIEEPPPQADDRRIH